MKIHEFLSRIGTKVVMHRFKFLVVIGAIASVAAVGAPERASACEVGGPGYCVKFTWTWGCAGDGGECWSPSCTWCV